ncbi:adenylate/guanylate cyclase domain-containing protein [Tateyamaria omphalii]|uniref:adenylate/guanylate cyclase domain-containing protein n=1 Tax=Tateyamaria omphalii TaxID=299262 RepID=UPI001C99D97F|nr:adenylate/guanylate cyclase domain-containing protein [Tateyamaria omphalii]MBY5933278.1 adenylate/guanylate cyclase domain-containing protein [Tateyamaria omphalii]
MVDASSALPISRRTDREDEIPAHRHAQEALARNKREGMDLAVKARVGALSVTAVMLVFLNPNWDVIWYLFLLFCLVLVGLAQRRVGRVGQSRAELALLFADLLLMTLALLVPNPLQTEVMPTALIYNFEVFQYFFIILAAGVLTYSWRTIIAIGNWTMAMWLAGTLCVWWFGRTFPGLTDAANAMFPNHPDLAQLFDPNDVNWDLRFQQVVVFLVVALILAVAVRRYQMLVLDSAEMARERTNLARYFSPSMVEELSTKDEPLGQIRSHDAAVLFVDIAGFTAYADGRPAEEVIETLRAFHARMESEVFAHGGTLDKYLGDGLMATFGTPLPSDDDAARAVACVLGMMNRMRALNDDRRADGLPEIDARFGLHFGPVVLGDIGANRMEFAVLGDTVNVANRLEAMTRSMGVRAIVSDAAMSAAGGADGFHRVSDQVVRGVADPLSVWVMD